MIKGKIEMVCDGDNINVTTRVEITNGLASKCTIIDALCDALNLEGEEKIHALQAIALREVMEEK